MSQYVGTRKIRVGGWGGVEEGDDHKRGGDAVLLPSSSQRTEQE